MTNNTLTIGHSFSKAAWLTIAAAVLSAIFGFLLLTFYRTSLYNTRFVSVDYPSLFLGGFNVVAFGLDLFAAMLLLLKKHTGLAVILLGLVLAFGVASPFVTNFVNPSHISVVDAPLAVIVEEVVVNMGLRGLICGLPMIAFSVPTLILILFNQRKTQNAYGRWPKLSLVIAGALMVTAAVVSAYSGLEILFGNGAYVAVHANWSYWRPAVMGILDLVVFGVAMPSGMLLLKRKQTGLAVALAGVVLALMVTMTAAGGFIPFDALAFGVLTIVASVTTLTLMGLNCRKLKQDTNDNNTMENSTRKMEA